jgi:hypothetical protein
MSKPTVFFFQNGNVAVTDDRGRQVSAAQKSVIETMCEKLVSLGYDPTTFDFMVGNGTARVFKTESGWNWSFSQEGT